MQGAQLRKTELGSTGLEITRVGLGAWAIGGGGFEWSWGTQEDDESIAAIHRALELGVNWIDTAAQYGFGHSEEVVGRAIAGLAERPYIFTKGGQPPGPGGATLHDLTRDGLRRELEGSLSRLGLEAVDLYQIHWPIPDEQIEAGWAALVELRDEGLTRHIGVSNFSVEQLSRAQGIAPVETLQPPYSLIAREVEDEILPFAGREGIGVIVYSPMGSGLLSGSMTRERIDALPDDDWRRRSPEFRDPRLAEHLALVERLRVVAERHGTTPGAVAVAWTLSNAAVDGAIVGFRRPDQVDSIVAAASLELDDEDVAEIDASARQHRPEQLRVRDRPDVTFWRIDLPVLGVDQRRELAAVRGWSHRVCRAADDGARDRIRAKQLELGPKVELVHEAAEPQRAPRREPGPDDGASHLGGREAAGHDLPDPCGQARRDRLRERQARGREEDQPLDEVRPVDRSDQRERRTHRVTRERDLAATGDLLDEPGSVRG
jgi:aryl-alcohol dehydrogenase-like predicted oxidoreductase